MQIKKFEIRPSKENGQHRAYIIGKNGEIIFWSEQYSDFHGALDAIALVDPQRKHMIDVLDADGSLKKRIDPR